MFNTKFFTALGSLFTSLRDKTTALADTTAKLSQAQSQLAQTTQTLAAGQVTTYTGKTGSDGLIVIDYTALGLKVAPRISFVPRLAKATEDAYSSRKEGGWLAGKMARNKSCTIFYTT